MNTLPATGDRPTGITADISAKNYREALSRFPSGVTVGLSKSADSYPAFTGAEKFAGAGFDGHPDGLPALRGAVARLSCSMYARHDGGYHDILVSRVVEEQLGQSQTPAVYHARRFHGLAPLGE